LFDRLWEKVVDIVFPPAVVAKNPTLTERVDAIKQAWTHWSEVVWPLINRLDMPWKEKAAQLRQEASKLFPLIRKAAANITEHLYPHLLFHLADQIERSRVDPYFKQTQGVEHRHKLRKKIHLLNTIFKKPGEQKQISIARYKRQDGIFVKAHVKHSGISREQQVLETVVTLDHLRALLGTHKCQVESTLKLGKDNKLRKAA
jgi:hypothetical protein